MEPGERTQDEGVERPVLHHASQELGAHKPENVNYDGIDR